MRKVYSFINKKNHKLFPVFFGAPRGGRQVKNNKLLLILAVYLIVDRVCQVLSLRIHKSQDYLLKMQK